MCKMRNYIQTHWERLASSSLNELVELFGTKISWPDVPPIRQVRRGTNDKIRKEYEYRDRIFNQWRTFWISLGQVLSPDQTYGEAQKKAQKWILKEKKIFISPRTSAYCQARRRLNQTYLDTINREVIEQTEYQVHRDAPEHLWYGRHVKIVDGSSVSMPDTEENQKLYPQPSSQKKGCGFPVMRIVSTFSLATGAMLACRKGSLHVHERTLWRDMWDDYQEGDVVLADCGFCSFADFHMLKERKVDCVMRPHQRRNEKNIVKRFNKNDYLVQWEKGKRCHVPKWMTPQQWDQLPDTITVRYVKVVVDIPGVRTKTLTVATTLLDEKTYPADALADLYRRRWLAEIFFRNIKITMRMKILKSKTPEMIHKEFTIFIIAYNLIRLLIWEAALSKQVDPYRISFKGAIAAIREWVPSLSEVERDDKKREFMDALLSVIAADIIPLRKKPRTEPRAVKRRPNPTYQLLTAPRHEFKEIPHRHHYKKERRKTM